MKFCPNCGAYNYNAARFCATATCGHIYPGALLGEVSSEVPLPRWCQPAAPRLTRFRLEDLSEREARDMGKKAIKA